MTPTSALRSFKNIAVGVVSLALALSFFFAAAPQAHAAGVLSGSQISAVVGLLSAFSVPQSTITSVTAILGGQSDTTSSQVRVTVSSKTYDTENPKITGTASGASSIFFDVVDRGHLVYHSDTVFVSSSRWSSKIEDDLEEGEYAVYVYTSDNVERARGTIKIVGLEEDEDEESDTTTISLTATPSSGSSPLAVAFRYKGPQAHAYTLNFGDNSDNRGAASCGETADTSPTNCTVTHTYRAAGTYTATLTKNTCPSGAYCLAGPQTIATKTITVSGSSESSATLTANPTSGTAPLAVSFKSSSGTAIDYGDGASDSFSYCQSTNCAQSGVSVSHTYAQAGTYTAKLLGSCTGDSSACSATPNDGRKVLATKTITVSKGSTSNGVTLSVKPSSGPAPLTVTFIGNFGTMTFLFLNHGDGTGEYISGAQNSTFAQTYTYSSPGTYKATLGPVCYEGCADKQTSATITVSGGGVSLGQMSPLLAATAVVPMSVTADSLNLIADQVIEVNYAIAGVLSAYVDLFSLDTIALTAAAAVAPPVAHAQEPVAEGPLVSTLSFLPQSLYETVGNTTDFLAAVEMAPLYVITDALSDALFKAGIY